MGGTMANPRRDGPGAHIAGSCIIIRPTGEMVSRVGPMSRGPLGLPSLRALEDYSERLILRGLSNPIGWSPDGQAIYAYELNQPKISRISERTGQVETVATLPGQIWSATMSKDGRTFVCEVGQTASDVWMVEHFDPDREIRTSQ